MEKIILTFKTSNSTFYRQGVDSYIGFDWPDFNNNWLIQFFFDFCLTEYYLNNSTTGHHYYRKKNILIFETLRTLLNYTVKYRLFMQSILLNDLYKCTLNAQLIFTFYLINKNISKRFLLNCVEEFIPFFNERKKKFLE